MTYIVGLDEAGRGPVLGPMVIAGVRVPRCSIWILRELGVKDSKHFGSDDRAKRRRAEIASNIRQMSFVSFAVISPTTIDRGNLGDLERRSARLIIAELRAEQDEIVADGHSIFKQLEQEFTHFKAHDKADQKFEVVSAASIVAKHIRDNHWQEIQAKYEKEFGKIKGNGYWKGGIEFIKKYHTKYGYFPTETRKSWKGVREIGA